jgi:hypothetical protein
LEDTDVEEEDGHADKDQWGVVEEFAGIEKLVVLALWNELGVMMAVGYLE